MKDAGMTLAEAIEFMHQLQVQGADWNLRIVKTPDGKAHVRFHDILTLDDLMKMDLDEMSRKELKDLLARVIVLQDRLDTVELDEDELSKDEREEIRRDLVEKAEELEIIIHRIQGRLACIPWGERTDRLFGRMSSMR